MIKITIKRGHLESQHSQSSAYTTTAALHVIDPATRETHYYPLHQNNIEIISTLIDEQKNLQLLLPLIHAHVKFKVTAHQMPPEPRTKRLALNTTS